MASYDKADLLSMFNEMAQRPASDEITDATKYARLARAQLHVINEIAARYPDALYGAPATLTTSDNKVYTFGTAEGSPIAPLGHVGIYRNLEDIPDYPMIPGVEYLDEGTQIRIPNNRTEASTLYWRGITTPDDLDASTEPAIRPAPARILIVLKAVMDFAREGNRRPDIAAEMERRWGLEFPIWMLTFKTRFRSGGALIVDTTSHRTTR